MGNRYKFCADFFAMHERVSGSCTLISVHRIDGDIKFIVDCGLYQGEEDCDAKNSAPFRFKPESVDFVLNTHNHADHVGRIPLLYKRGYYKKVYTTKDTKIMLPIAFQDNEKILSMNAKKNNKKPLYNLKDVEHTLMNVISCEFNDTFEPYPGVKVTFFKNGHLIGSAIILVQISCYGYEDINILFTGDYKSDNQFFNVPELPDWVTKLPLHIMCESTYGSVDSNTTSTSKFIINISNWFNNCGIKTIVVPTLSLGRFQEISYNLKCAQQDNQLDSNIPIRFDGNLAIKYTNLFKYSLDISPEMNDFMPQNSSFVECTNRNDVISFNGKQIIVTTAGMASYGPAQEYIPKLIEREDVGIHFTSFLSPGTTGAKIMNSNKNELVTIGAVVKKRVAEVATTNEFSKHARRDELIAFLSKFENIRTLLINHGEPTDKENFAKYCKQNLSNCKEVAILGNGYIVRVDRWKITKVIHDKL